MPTDSTSARVCRNSCRAGHPHGSLVAMPKASERPPAGAGGLSDFDVHALFAALDDRRQQSGLSWKQVADQIWQQSWQLNDARRDHPIAPATLTGMDKRGAVSCQHVLFMLRWLGRAPEDFLAAPVPGTDRTPLPAAGPDRRLRWHLRALYAAMDARRREQQLTWAALAEILSCMPSQLTGLRNARFATGIRVAMRITQWLGRPAADFVYVAKW
jgi:hypothetical protein